MFNKDAERHIRYGALIAILLATPMTLSASDGLAMNEAAACGPTDTGTCCPQDGAYCVIGKVVLGGHYYLSSGPCPQT